jgi:uncharacterized protein (DUF3820 family)
MTMPKEIDKKKVEAAVRGRAFAKTICELAEIEAGLLDNGDSLIAYWLEIRKLALKYVPLPETTSRPKPKPMTDAEQRKFEKTSMPFGKYEGVPVGIVYEKEPDYLDWLAGSRNQFVDDLNKYLLAMGRTSDAEE